MGSVKDRLALGVIEWAERNGEISPGQTVVECTSGNTGIGLAMVCAAKGYPLVCVMSESFSIERRKLMRFLGAKVVLTNPAHKGKLQNHSATRSTTTMNALSRERTLMGSLSLSPLPPSTLTCAQHHII